MNKESSVHNEKSSAFQKAARKQGKEGSTILESILTTGSWQRVTVGVAAAAGAGLLAASLVGVGPAALAGAAGYLAYRGMKGQKKSDETSFTEHKH